MNKLKSAIKFCFTLLGAFGLAVACSVALSLLLAGLLLVLGKL